METSLTLEPKQLPHTELLRSRVRLPLTQPVTTGWPLSQELRPQHKAHLGLRAPWARLTLLITRPHSGLMEAEGNWFTSLSPSVHSGA